MDEHLPRQGDADKRAYLPDWVWMRHDSLKIAWTLLSPPNTNPLPPTYTVGPTDQAIARATGVFWRVEADGFHMDMNYIQRADGATQHAPLGREHQQRSWADVSSARQDLQTGFIAFGVCVTLHQLAIKAAPSPDTVGPQRRRGSSARATAISTCSRPTRSPTSAHRLLEPESEQITQFFPTEWPRAASSRILPMMRTSIPTSSRHPTAGRPVPARTIRISCYVCFVDGHALALSRNVDIRVYTRSLSPAGSIYGQPVDGDVK